MLRLARAAFDDLCDHLIRGYPLEACGLLAGPKAGPDGAVVAERFYPCANTAASALRYTIDPGDHLRAELDAERSGWDIVGVVHSHTHTEPFPSPTDIAQAPDPSWQYVIVSLKRDAPELRSYRIVDAVVTEVAVELVDGSHGSSAAPG